MTLGKRKMEIKFILEYVDQNTEESLKKALPLLKGLVTKRISRLHSSDLHKLQTPQGKQELANDVLALIRDVLPGQEAKNSFLAVEARAHS